MDTCERLPLFADESMDFVFSSHLLEHIENTQAALTEWWRVLKVGGYLVLYLPHAGLYPNIGEEGANPDHKHDFVPDDITGLMRLVGSWDLLRNESRDYDNGPGQPGNEYSFFQVFRKADHGMHVDMTAKPEKSACVVRYGGVGDMIQASSILPALKEAGYHVTMCTTPAGEEIVRHDPHIDDFLIQDKDQVPNHQLGEYWDALAARFDRFINLSESTEGSLLAMPGRAAYAWPASLRHSMMNHSYLEMVHSIAMVPRPFRAAFYPTEKEDRTASDRRGSMGRDNIVVLWVLRGTAPHKRTLYVDQVVARLLVVHKNIKVVLVGDPLCEILETGWEDEPRVIGRSGKWSIRETLAFARHADVVVGPETGVLNSVGCIKSVAKVVMLSHSSEKNLATGWENTIALAPSRDDAPCYPCHKMHQDWSTCLEHHYSEPFCERHGISTKGGILDCKTAACVAHVYPDAIYDAIETAAGLRGPALHVVKEAANGDQ